MAKWGKTDFKQLKEFQKNMNKLEVDSAFLESCAKELAARLLAKIIKRTPVGVYKDRTGGTLRRGWTAGKRSSAKRYVDNLKVKRVGKDYVIEIINPVEYASYVEFGHRTSNHKGWVEGRFMLTISEKEIEAQSAGILEKKLLKFLGDVVDDKKTN